MDTLCESYLELTDTDQVLVVYSEELADDDHQELLGLLGDRIRASAARVAVQPASYLGEGRLDDHLADTDVLVLVSLVSSIHRAQVLEHLAQADAQRRVRVYRLFNFSPELFTLSLAMDRPSLDALNEGVITAGRTATDIHVTNDHGTDVHIRPLPDGGWTNSCGFFSGRFPAILPPGEVNTYTPHVTGTVVANGALNSSFGFPGDPRLGENPVTLDIVESVVEKATCADPLISAVLNNFFEVENANRVGEVGFGTNEGITEWVGFVSHINERHPGLHLGLGTPSQPKSKTGWGSPLHLDMILDGCEIRFDGRLVFSDGRWDRDALKDLSQGAAQGDVMHVDAV